MSTQLHQIIACENDVVKQAESVRNETETTFLKKQEHFDGLRKDYSAKSDDEEQIPPEVKEVVTTVADKLSHTEKFMIKAINLTLSKEETNSSGNAKAELVVDGTTFGTFSATSLLALEKKLVSLRKLYEEIPTLDPSRTWDKSDIDNIFQTKELKYRTAKKVRAMTLAPATDKHPAQVQLVNEDVQVGTYNTTYYSGKIRPKLKSEYLERIDNLLVEVKKAREKANQVDVVDVTVASKIFDYIRN